VVSPAGGLLSLPIGDQTVARPGLVEADAPEAPCGVGYVWCTECGLTVRDRCRRNGCSWCGPINARQTAQAIALAGPERSYLLTQAGRDWQTVRARMKRFRYRLRQLAGAAWFDCWHVEPNPSGDGQHHVHGLQHGEFVDVETFRAAAGREGFGSWVGLRRVREGSSASFYGLKMASLAAAAYGLKGVGSDLEEYLQANGGRMVHASRGFWREPSAGGWVSLRGVRPAIRSARWRVGRSVCPASGEAHSWDGTGFRR
jgi:hypothetical protein